MKRKLLLGLLALVVLGCAFTAWTFLPSPLPAPAPWSGPLPAASPPEGMEIFQLPTGTYETPAALAYRGGSFSEKRDFAATAILVKHPKGDLLFDTGFGSQVEAQLAGLPSFQQSPHHIGETAKAQLAAANYDFTRLKGVVLTHAHWDHVSGLTDLTVPAWMNAAEQQYAKEDVPVTKAFKALTSLKVETYDFEGPAYLGFPRSHDVWGDGSIVLVPAPGHTPGSIVAFITLPSGKRYALIGDLTWQQEGIDLRAERPLMLRMVADTDAAELRTDLARIIALKGLVTIVPAHELRAYADIPRLK